MNDSGWDFMKFDDGSLKAAENNQLKKYGEFLTKFSHSLDNMLEEQGGCISTSWDSFLDPIELHCMPTEMSSLLGLVNTNNKIFNKIIVTLAACCSELIYLKHEAETKYLPSLLYYGEGMPDNCYDDGKVPIQLGRFLPQLQNILCFVNRCGEAVKHTVQQLSCLYAKSVGPNKLFDVSDVHFSVVFHHLSSILAVLISLDEILTSPSLLQEDWELYKRILTSVKHDPNKYEITLEKVKPFEKLLMTMEGRLMDGKVFQACVEQNFEDGPAGVHVRPNTVLIDYFTATIRSFMADLDSRLNSSQEAMETNERLQFAGLCGLVALHFNLFGSFDKKLFRDIFSFHSKLPAIVLCGSITWQPCTFLVSRLPALSSQLDKKLITKAASRPASYLEERTAALPREIDQLMTRTTGWMVRMEGDFRRGRDLGQDLAARCNLIIEGIHFAYKCKQLCQTVLCMHATLKKPLSKSVVLVLCRGVELCKAIEAAFHRRSMLIVESISQIMQSLVSNALQTIDGAKRRVINQSEKRYTERHLDVLSALLLVQQMLSGAGTKDRRLVVRLALAVGQPMGSIKEDEQAALNNLLRRIDIIADLWESIRESCDCSFFFWHRESIFQIYVQEIFNNADGVQRMQFFLAGLQDPVRGMLATRHKEHASDLVQDYEKEVKQTITTYLLDPLCREVETDLRLQVHSHLLQRSQDTGPFGQSGQGGSPHSTNRDLAHFLKARPIRCFDKLIHIRGFVELYLEKTFYNLTTISLPDWRTYGEMKKLAEQKYHLEMGELHLPSQTLEQGTDVLQIMRSMSDFSGSHVYNLNTQVFIQKSSENKHLNTVNIRHVANSIRTHGLGIVSTTVNNTYLFLKGKFFHFSEFLFDERVKGKILKEWHEYKEKHMEQDQMFPFKFAERLKRNMRKMHVYPDGTDPLERFRNHISRIGNAMGFVRLIRSGCLNCCSHALSFLPSLEETVGFQEIVTEAGLDQDTVHSAKNLDEVIENLTKNFAKDTDYFKLFVEVFAVEFRSKKNIHCRNFFVLLPALCLSHVESVIAAKDRLNKKNKEGAGFTDDGFAMGVAFLLKVLDLYKEFDSLNWFNSISDHYRREKEEVARQLSGGRLEEKLRQTHTLTLRRLDQWEKECRMLCYSLTSARVFFRADQTAAEDGTLTQSSST